MHIFVKPPRFFYFSYIKLRHIWLDIQKRSSIYNVYIPNMEYVLFDSNKTYY